MRWPSAPPTPLPLVYPPALLGCPRIDDLPAPEARARRSFDEEIARALRTMPRTQLMLCALTMIEIGWQELREAARREGPDSRRWIEVDAGYAFVERVRHWFARGGLDPAELMVRAADSGVPALERYASDMLAFILSDVRDRGGFDASGASVDQFGLLVLAKAGERYARPEAIARWWARCQQRLAFAKATEAVLLEPDGVYPSPLDDLRLCGPCDEEWRDMLGDDRVRLCAHCDKQVYNLADMSPAEALEVLEGAAGRLCARAFVREDGTLVLDAPCAGERHEPVFPKAVGLVAPTSRLTEQVVATIDGLHPRDPEHVSSGAGP